MYTEPMTTTGTAAASKACDVCGEINPSNVIACDFGLCVPRSHTRNVPTLPAMGRPSRLAA